MAFFRWFRVRVRRLVGIKAGRCAPSLPTAIVIGISTSVFFLVYVSFTTTIFKHDEDPVVAALRDTTGPPVTPKPSLTRDFSRHKVELKILIVTESQYTKQGHYIAQLLEACRFKVKFHTGIKGLPTLIHKQKGKFTLVVFERLETYLNLDEWNRELLDKYLLEYNVGMIVFTHPDVVLFNARARGFPLHVHSQLRMKDYEVTDATPIPRISKSNIVVKGELPGHDWTVFIPSHETYVPLSYAKLLREEQPQQAVQYEHKHITVLYDQGLHDGIQRVLFGNSLQFWLHRVLFLDAVRYLSHGKLSIGLDRFLLVDIDDVFVSKEGTRMVADDVEALLQTQYELRKAVPGFTFNLGFSGAYFEKGSDKEDEGDRKLLEYSSHFWWFGHMWSHRQAHQLNLEGLVQEMNLNKQFALSHGIPINNSYAIAPHHSGVFPVHEQLYQAWTQVWNIRVTSTEEYPHLRHAYQRRGFIHRGLQVLPRQTCGLFTHTVLFENEQIPNFKDNLDRSIYGGELFMTFLYTPILIFMTHLPNYAQDRLGLYTFTAIVEFVQQFTNLRLVTRPPLELAETYFRLYPQDMLPVWRNPCNDKRHLEIWSADKDCHRLPDVLVVGPQKTGTTALYTFLAMHPAILSNFNSPVSYEEVQFFNGNNYLNGLDWYLEYFPGRDSNRSWPMVFEKSANYFDAPLAPRRAAALLPKAKILVILIDPALRAYSWYQHQRAHRTPAAISHTFEEILASGDDATKAVRDLKTRCLYPGVYVQHLQAWLEFFPAKQVLIIDGEQLKTNPVATMDNVQMFLDVHPYLDYSFKLRYNKKKGFYCVLTDSSSRIKCLGGGKGRNYEPMSQAAAKYLAAYYRKPNVMLAKMLSKLNVAAPSWLKEQLEQENK